ncbi:glycine betaine ABC transporter substrate-binding protein [Sediminibacillus halophilus]|uniref:Glycine betaine/proline transport system substrate-binding protein n=1 Tax=Sediminibacillus halophilus TaxID=482461 RepID=A0A1G9PQX9_9BACI|nr:glycine betaine ABC transporter substrate-binding protein [Sediminibacillus halophilus]SDM00505.1 glycine betaine/proline transport system substrate-binding protein [Sediminibacillus halophilus]
MINLNLKRLGLAAGLSLTLVAAGCGSDDSSDSENAGSDNGGGETNYSEEMDYTITGIEPGAGVVQAAEDATETYDSLAGWEVETSSSGAMATALGEAIDNEEPIVVTGWTPHWMFAKYDLKYLEDPEGSFGEAEEIKTMVRKGLKDDMPNAYQILDQFNWESSDMEEVMLEISNGTSPEDAAAAWVEDNSDKVAEWTKGTEEVDGKEIELAYVEWDSEVASTNVMKKVLEDQGFKVTITPLDNAVMWQAVANGDADGMVAAWMPATHAAQFEEYGDQVEDLGANLEGAKIGLVVPKYMDVDSIEDLQPAE